VGVSDGVPEPVKVPVREGVPEPVGVIEDVADDESVPYEEPDGVCVYSGEEVLIDSAVKTGDKVTEEDTVASTEASGLILPHSLADANSDPEEEGLTEPSSDTVPKTERVAVENASDGLALILADIE